MGSSPIRVARNASVAQLVEQRTENPRVVGSIPTGGTIADLAHLVERDLAKVEVAGSSPVIRSKKENHPRSRVGGSFFFFGTDYGARTALDRLAVKGGKNADLALQVVAFSHQGILFSSSAIGA